MSEIFTFHISHVNHSEIYVKAFGRPTFHRDFHMPRRAGEALWLWSRAACLQRRDLRRDRRHGRHAFNGMTSAAQGHPHRPRRRGRLSREISRGFHSDFTVISRSPGRVSMCSMMGVVIRFTYFHFTVKFTVM